MKTSSILLLAIVGLVVCVTFSEAQNGGGGRRRNRGRGRGRKGPNCHMKEIDKCLEKMEALGKRQGASDIITTAAGLDELCTTATGTTDCIKAYMKKCGTPIQRELFDFMIEQFVESVKLFCNDGEGRTIFLEHSPCINSKVLTKKSYHKKCVNDIFASIYKGTLLFNNTIDDPNLFDVEKTKARGLSDTLLDLSCCSYNRFEDCANAFISKECGSEAVTVMTNFAQKTFGGSMNMICPRNLFNPKDKACVDILPATGSDPKTATLFNNPLGKYALTYLNFLFNFGDEVTGTPAAAGAASSAAAAAALNPEDGN